MHFDDRLATVLRSRTGGDRAARTQYRQLLDLIGSAPSSANGELMEQAFDRLDALAQIIPAEQRAAILREPGLRLRNKQLVAWLANAEPGIAASVMATARLQDGDWQGLIPALPVPARGLLRHRRDLSPATRDLLAKLGVQDLILPEPEGFVPSTENSKPQATPVFELHPGLEAGLVAPPTAPARPAPPRPAAPEPAGRAADVDIDEDIDEDIDDGIGALVNRIEAFQLARKTGQATPDAPRLPLNDRSDESQRRQSNSFDFSADAQGRIDWADPAIAPMVIGLELGTAFRHGAAICDDRCAAAMQKRLPVHGGQISITGARAIEGSWRIDAAPHFDLADGHFQGYRGRFRRNTGAAADMAAKGAAQAESADRIRQMLHELRTPVNAIQGFAEVIQQQILGPAPNEYRALAAAIGVDIARIQAGFDELERLARLESGVMEMGDGWCDMRAIVAENIRRLSGALRPRSASLELVCPDSTVWVQMADSDAQQMIWRLLASLAGSIAPGEILEIHLQHSGKNAELIIEIPASLEETADLFSAKRQESAKAITAGMFGTGFAMRLARAEAKAVSGNLVREENRLHLNLPLFFGHHEGSQDSQNRHGGNNAAAS